MLDTVLLARDKYLAKGGMMFPDQATLFLAGIEDAEYKEEKIGFWDDVYGFDYSCIKEIALREPLVDTVEARTVVTKACPILVGRECLHVWRQDLLDLSLLKRPSSNQNIDLLTVTKEELSFTAPFALQATRKDCELASFGCNVSEVLR